LLTGPGPPAVLLARFDVEAARREVDTHLALPLQVAREARRQGPYRRDDALHGMPRRWPLRAGTGVHHGAHGSLGHDPPRA
jgi:hypothetical protein